ncbi:MAG: hypothetical protein HKN50_01460 [Gammaproteobacteria bacterium]|nr:hypothetical protein [Gammaproteobacteria bacterium]
MKPIATLFLLALLFASPPLKASCGSLEDLRWMLGEWRSVSDQNTTTEFWKEVSDNTFEGWGSVRARIDGQLKSEESLRLLSMSGSIFYVVKVAHNVSPVAFEMTHCAAENAVFENAAHDFPKRIAYRLDKSVMQVRLSDGAEKGFEIRFKPVDDD